MPRASLHHHPIPLPARADLDLTQLPQQDGVLCYLTPDGSTYGFYVKGHWLRCPRVGWQHRFVSDEPKLRPGTWTILPYLMPARGLYYGKAIMGQVTWESVQRALGEQLRQLEGAAPTWDGAMAMAEREEVQQGEAATA